jgi:hypothetical protein
MWHKLPAACPVTQRAASLGAHVTLHEPHGPIAGALHDAPASTFCFTSFSFFFLELSCAASAGLGARYAAMITAAIVPIAAPLSSRRTLIVASRRTIHTPFQ